MKLILCKNCQDVVRLRKEERFCRCGKCSGKYTDDLNAWYKGGDDVIPLGFANSSFISALRNQPKEGWGENFTAFVIPEICDTFKKITEKPIEIKEVDFSILNEDDVFYAEFTDGESAVLKGELLGDRISSTQCIYSHTGWDCGINEFTFDYVKSLRLATADEKELFYKHFPNIN